MPSHLPTAPMIADTIERESFATIFFETSKEAREWAEAIRFELGEEFDIYVHASTHIHETKVMVEKACGGTIPKRYTFVAIATAIADAGFLALGSYIMTKAAIAAEEKELGL